MQGWSLGLQITTVPGTWQLTCNIHENSRVFPVNSAILQDEGYPTIWGRHLHRISAWACDLTCKTSLVSYERTLVMSKSHALEGSLKLETYQPFYITTDCGHATSRDIPIILLWMYPSKPSLKTPSIPRFWRSATCNETIVEVHGQGGKCPKGNLACQIFSGSSKGEGPQIGFSRRPLLVWYVLVFRLDAS